MGGVQRYGEPSEPASSVSQTPSSLENLLPPPRQERVLMPLVSVIIPTYNRASLLEEAVRSVWAQTYRDREVIIADDGSTDGTDLVLRKLERESLSSPECPPLRLLRQEHRGMPGQVRNFAARAASGRYLAFLDSDDLWQPEKLARQLPLFEEQPGIRLIHTRELWLRGGRVVSQGGQNHRRLGDVFEAALEKCILGPSTVVLERSLFDEVGGFREDMEIAEDYELWLRITALHEVGYLDEPLTVKRAGGWPQLSEKYGHIEGFRIEALRPLVEQDYFPPPRRASAQQVLSRKCAIYARGCRKRGRDEEARRYEFLAESYRSSRGNRAQGIRR